MKTLTNTIDVIDLIGGNQAVAELLQAHPKAVANWRYSGVFPANTYLVLNEALRRRRCSAPDSLWAMKPALEKRKI